MRDDLTNSLVHLTKGTGSDPAKHRAEAVETLENILTEKALRGGTGFIKGGYRCVCFSEAPISKLSYLLAAKDSAGFKYQPYGVMVQKKWLFERGGRPVIYGPEGEFSQLPEEMKYRHVRFWLGDYTVDHTWEREWRLRADKLDLASSEITVVIPDRHGKGGV